MESIIHLADRHPQVTVEELVAGLRPSPRFGEVSFDSYIPDPNQPTQAAAVTALRNFAASVGGGKSEGGFFGKLFGGSKNNAKDKTAGIYLDGGFGVGKTHLLASLWHAAPGPKAFGTFVEYTNLVGALSFRKAVDMLSTYKLVCIDEFELDDPGDTVLMSRLMRELADAGVKIAATSNTLPGSLGEGRFAAVDFKREIQVLADQFTVLRIDGEDYRHRGLPAAPQPIDDDAALEFAQSRYPGRVISEDDFSTLIEHLSTVHPSRYRQFIDGIDVMVLHNVHTITAQNVALRFVVLADRLYDRDVPIIASGAPFDQLFTEEMMNGGYMKKYYRTVSRMTALAREGTLVTADES
ncbi:cell division protein ZapE [Neomicrococcus aestuarii]|uniref:Cell division protein ZapE n=1 Tax=Neomicrococcus aestuarii TaxID=556325 RepID=A0A1L2ZLA4_9MICC|nr:cell division protein ZapE [Neomicrococcus aestuarii]APF39798.1 cell division protein ZapE [Neomicrococcus aestuarii]MBB5513833.1 cell division protein ZapE [Neomicrococcus aestuarii]